MHGLEDRMVCMRTIDPEEAVNDRSAMVGLYGIQYSPPPPPPPRLCRSTHKEAIVHNTCRYLGLSLMVCILGSGVTYDTAICRFSSGLSPTTVITHKRSNI